MTLSSLESRCARLSAELEDAAAAVEVLRAKGRAYDEVEARAERMVGAWRGSVASRWLRVNYIERGRGLPFGVAHAQRVWMQVTRPPHTWGARWRRSRTRWLRSPTTLMGYAGGRLAAQEGEVARLRPFEASAAQLAQRLREAGDAARAAEAREAVAATEKAYVIRELQVGRTGFDCALASGDFHGAVQGGTLTESAGATGQCL